MGCRSPTGSPRKSEYSSAEHSPGKGDLAFLVPGAEVERVRIYSPSRVPRDAIAVGLGVLVSPPFPRSRVRGEGKGLGCKWGR